MDKDLVKCSVISVDCVHNDVIDIKSGGPLYLGFDFYVHKDIKEEMQELIVLALEEYHIPLVKINSAYEIKVPHSKVWNKDKIITEIENKATFLCEQNNKNKQLKNYFKGIIK